MALGRALYGLTLSIGVMGCGTPDDSSFEDTGFYVGEVVPADGDQDVLVSASPNLLLSAPASAETCTVSTVQLVAVAGSNAVATHIDATLEFDGDEKIIINPDNELVPGFTYMVTVRSGVEGCTSEDGLMIRPFASRFTVSD